MDEQMDVDPNEEVLRVCEERTKDISKHWGPLGVLLKMDEPLLRQIKDDSPDDASACSSMLNTWLTSNPREPLTDLDNALEKFKDFKKTDKVVVSARVDSDIDIQIMRFKQQFRDVLLQTLAWLKRRFPDVKQAKLWVNGSTIGPRGTPLAIEGNIKDYDNFGEELQRQWRYTCPDILQRLISEEGTEDLKRSMELYMTDFQEFHRNFKLERTTTFDDLDETKPCLIIIFRTGTSLHNIEVFLEDVFGRCKCHLHYQRIEVSSVKVYLQFPASMTPLLEECIDFYYKNEAVEQNKVNMCIKPLTEKKRENLIKHSHIVPSSPHIPRNTKNKVLTPSTCALPQHVHPTCSVQSCV